MFAEGDLETALRLFEEAFELAKRVGDRDVQMLSLSGKGRALIKSGDIDKGLALLDEASASAMCGDLRAHSAGLVYCITISSCQDLGDVRRAAEWTEAANRWCDKLDVSGFPGACRIHRAEVLRLRGDWPAAEAQAVAACDELQDFDRSITASGHYEIGEIRRQRGDFTGAEESYRVSNEMGRDPQPGLSLLRLAEGKVDAAVAGITRKLQDTTDPLVRFRSLPAQVEIAIAARDLKSARAAADEAEQIVDSYKIGKRRAAAFDATVNFLRGQISLAEKEWTSAIAALKHARDEWQGVGAPYETARARMLLGTAYMRSGDEHAATVELEGALATFERLGARLDEARVKELLGRVEARRTFLFTDIVDSTRLLDTLGGRTSGSGFSRATTSSSASRSRRTAARWSSRPATASSPRSRTRRRPSTRPWAFSAHSPPRSSRPTYGSAHTREVHSAPGLTQRTTVGRASTSPRGSGQPLRQARSSSAWTHSTALARHTASRSSGRRH